ncbi:DUF2512 family protein [Salicibibacter halophilus]|uniref:DUF2512 family protein n=1 Tax=Salicibibacter halophilus TaxID=2502791 RepID=A0A514LG12_9BACI|nr:YndM family protein [Salicibibacter halophilus]QDI90794.1 DUF2512 family protein [Salicibibacter halophilus]
MNHVVALIIKFVMITAVLWLILGGFFNVGFGNIFLISIIMTGVAYLIGDLWILPQFGNVVATIADFGLVFAGVWALAAIFEPTANFGSAAFFSAVIIAIGEIFFHMYVRNTVLNNPETTADNNRQNTSDRNLQTEFGTETDAARRGKKNKD